MRFPRKNAWRLEAYGRRSRETSEVRSKPKSHDLVFTQVLADGSVVFHSPK